MLIRGRMVAALFEHCSARSERGQTPDPQLHTHAVILNVCLGSDDTWRTLDARHLFWQKMTAGALYRAELLHLLATRLQLVPVWRKGFVEVAGVDERLIATFSKRRRRIEERLQHYGAHSAKLAAQVALETRSKKVEVHRAALLAAWQQEGERFPFRIPRQVHRTVQLDALKAIRTVEETKCHYPRRDVLRALAEDAGVAPIAELRRVANEARLVHLRVLRGEVQFTTKSMLALEDELLRCASLLTFRCVASAEPRPQASLSAEQQDALAHVLKPRALTLVSGLAGTGKTTLLREANRALASFDVHGAALAAQAARNLELGSGIPSQSVHKTLHDLRAGRLQLHPKSVLVVDEASMLGTRLLHELMLAVEKTHAKLVLVGDERQLSAIEAGNPFPVLLERCGAARMAHIERQREPWARDAARDFAFGDVERALHAYEQRGLVVRSKQALPLLKRIAREATDSDALVLASTREEVNVLNALLQEERYRRGDLERHEAVATEDDALFFVGDRVRFRKNRPDVLNGEVGTVIGLSNETRSLTVQVGERYVDVELQRYPHLELAYAGTTHAAQGATVERCFVYVSEPASGRAMTYVQATRARAETRFYLRGDCEPSMARDTQLFLAQELA